MVGMDWIFLAKDRNKCRALLSTVRAIGFLKMRGFLELLGDCWLLKKD
jgi:hypothetical protein